MTSRPHVAIACGGTGGHFYPGLAVAHKLRERGCEVTLWISVKAVDRRAAKAAGEFTVRELSAVALSPRAPVMFLRGLGGALARVRREFNARLPNAVLAMGGFTSAAPIFLGRLRGAATFLHESNFIPGRANRLLAPWVDEVFVRFPEARHRLSTTSVTVTGTPVRPGFDLGHTRASREVLGLDPARPTVLVMGGSQGARGLNRLTFGALALLARMYPRLQFLHLTGAADEASARAAYQRHGLKCAVYAFLEDTAAAMAAATVVVSRAGASSLAELAVCRRPAILVPFPSAADDHQRFNARAMERAGAACWLDEVHSTPEDLAAGIVKLTENLDVRRCMQAALAELDAPNAAATVAIHIMRRLNNQASTRRPSGFSLAVS